MRAPATQPQSAAALGVTLSTNPSQVRSCHSCHLLSVANVSLIGAGFMGCYNDSQTIRDLGKQVANGLTMTYVRFTYLFAASVDLSFALAFPIA